MRASLLLLVLAACDSRLTPIDSRLSVEPLALAFTATPAGDVHVQSLVFTNGARSPLKLRLTAPSPFALDLELKLQGGEARAVDVAFAPAEIGAASAVLQVSGDLELQVALSGEAVTAAVCVSPGPCRLASRDPATNTCVETNAPDGAACTSDNACLAEGRCLAGACLGAAVSCDDANACTVDACEPEGGCSHAQVACATPADPCQVARCDPGRGCVTGPAVDGTACGPSDCATARVCMAGQCRTLSVPDGYACGDETPCRAKGRCAAGACNQAPPTALNEAWQRQLPYETDFRGVTDASGNLYWVECSHNRGLQPCELVSVTAGGFERLRVTVPTLSAPGGVRHLWSAGKVVVAGPGGSLAVHSDATGALVWGRAAASLVTLTELAADRQGRLVTLERQEGESESWLLARYELATGAGTAKALFGRPSGLVLDEADDAYFALSGALSQQGGGTGANVPALGPRLVSYSAGGALRFQVSTGGVDPPVAAFGGELLLASGEVRATADGALRPSTKRWAPLRAPAPLMSAAGRFRWQDDQGCVGDSNFLGLWLQLEGYTPGVAAPRFRWAAYTYAAQASEQLLLHDGSALFASSLQSLLDVDPQDDGVFLRAVEPSGAERFACRIGPATLPDRTLSYVGSTALTNGRWAVVEQAHCGSCEVDPPPVLRVFSTPGLSLAASGWTGPRGTPGGAGAPR